MRKVKFLLLPNEDVRNNKLALVHQKHKTRNKPQNNARNHPNLDHLSKKSPVSLPRSNLQMRKSNKSKQKESVLRSKWENLGKDLRLAKLRKLPNQDSQKSRP